MKSVPTPPVALSIAGTDSGGGAGIAADLRTFASHGVFGTLAVTAVTAQNTKGVEAVSVLSADIVAAQIESVVADLGPAAAKTGMLASPEIVAMVTEKVRNGDLPPLVVDPVLVASSGDPLFEGQGTKAAYCTLASVATVLTPNLPEASLLLGRSIESLAEMEQAAHDLHELGAGLVVVKGGHAPGKEAVDVVYDGASVAHLRAPWVETRNVHGTGCSFSAAICANLAKGLPAFSAVQAAKEYVFRAISLAAGWELGVGHGPIDHFGAADAWQDR
jgi:hydroxymethylpyrimidine/phosphomethylpyrimidine kinase